MRNFLYALLLLLVSCSLKKNGSDTAGAVDKQPSLQETIENFRLQREKYKAEYKSDSLDILNIQFAGTLAGFGDSIWNFNPGENDPVYVAVSGDKKFALLSWDTWMGGTMTDYATIAFYKTGNMIRHKMIFDSENGDSLNSLFHYDTIVTLKNDNRNIYLAQGFGKGSSALLWEDIEAFEINTDTISSPAIFPEYEETGDGYPSGFSKNKFTSSVGIEFDLHHCDESITDYRPVSLFADNNRMIRIPVVGNEGGNTKQYHTLVFDGQHFKKQQTVFKNMHTTNPKSKI